MRVNPKNLLKGFSFSSDQLYNTKVYFNNDSKTSSFSVWLDVRTAETVDALISKTPGHNKDYLRVSFEF